jgi:hypothetical protein
MDEQIWTVTEVASYLKMSPRQVRELPRRGGQPAPCKRAYPLCQLIPANNSELSEAAPPKQNPEQKRAAKLRPIDQVVVDTEVNATIEEAVRKAMSGRRGPTKEDDIQDAISETLTRLLEPENAMALLSQSRLPYIDPATGKEVNDFLTFVYKFANKVARQLKRRAVSRKEIRIVTFEGKTSTAPWDDHTLPMSKGSTGKDARRFRISRQHSAEDKLIAKIDVGAMLTDADGQLAREYIENRHHKVHTPAERVAFHRAKARLVKKYQERVTPAVTNGPAKGTFTVGRPVRDVRYTQKSTHFG